MYKLQQYKNVEIKFSNIISTV